MTFTPVTITGGGNQSRGDSRSWKVSKMALLSELAAHLESSGLRIINTPMGQELISELNSFEVDFTSAGNMRVDVLPTSILPNGRPTTDQSASAVAITRSPWWSFERRLEGWF